MRTLDQLQHGEEGFIRSILAKGALAQRLLALGLLPGIHVKVLAVAPFGDPITVQAGAFQISLRRSEAGAIEIDGAVA